MGIHGLCVLSLVALTVLLPVHGDQDDGCIGNKEVQERCEAQFHQQTSGNFTVDCSNGIVQDYADCLGEAMMCTNQVEAEIIQNMLNYEFGYTRREEEDHLNEKRRISCRFYCYPTCSFSGGRLRCDGVRCVFRCSFKRETEESNICNIVTQEDRFLNSASAMKPTVIITAFIVVIAHLLSY